jgi:hypothetical protein
MLAAFGLDTLVEDMSDVLAFVSVMYKPCVLAACWYICAGSRVFWFGGVSFLIWRK